MSVSNTFTSYVYNQSGIASTSRSITGLNDSTTYYWRVNEKNTYGISSYSSVWSFSTYVVEAPVPCPRIPTVTYEGKTYNTVQIGNQCWLRENLDVGTRINGSGNQTDNSTIEKYCYIDDPANCSTYGGLYQWNEMMQYSTAPGTQGICPTGWHIPTLAEFEALKAAVNNNCNALKAIGQGTGNGQGTNTSGFSALLAGGRGYNGGFGNLGYVSYFWSSTEYYSSVAGRMYLYGGVSGIALYDNYKGNGFSVRCVKD